MATQIKCPFCAGWMSIQSIDVDNDENKDWSFKRTLYYCEECDFTDCLDQFTDWELEEGK
jgi:hypothetical protein